MSPQHVHLFNCSADTCSQGYEDSPEDEEEEEDDADADADADATDDDGSYADEEYGSRKAPSKKKKKSKTSSMPSVPRPKRASTPYPSNAAHVLTRAPSSRPCPVRQRQRR
jgi:chromodomain-helicase-DNA-binding protein 1